MLRLRRSSTSTRLETTGRLNKAAILSPIQPVLYVVEVRGLLFSQRGPWLIGTGSMGRAILRASFPASWLVTLITRRSWLYHFSSHALADSQLFSALHRTLPSVHDLLFLEGSRAACSRTNNG